MERLREPLGEHAAWVVERQSRHGTWEGDAAGDFARAPALVNFLIWYDQRVDSDRDVQRAVRRACRPYRDADTREDYGLFGPEENYLVLTAFAGRAVASIVAARPVP